MSKFDPDSLPGYQRTGLLTKPFSRPPVRLLDRWESNLGVQPEPVVQVRCPALGLANDVEMGETAQAVVFALIVVQVVPKYLPEVIKYDSKAPRIQCIGVGCIRICGCVSAVLFIPTRVLAIWKEFIRNYWKHLQHKEQQFQSRQQKKINGYTFRI